MQNQTDAMIQASQKIGATVAVASTPMSFFESPVQMISLVIGIIGVVVAAFSAWVNYSRFQYQKAQDRKEVCDVRD